MITKFLSNTILLLLLACGINDHQCHAFIPSISQPSKSIGPVSSERHVLRQNDHSFMPLHRSIKTPMNMVSPVVASEASTSLLSSLSRTISLFSKSNVGGVGNAAILDKVIEIGVSTPPIAYFSALIAAGFGIPVSEDALCIFIGSILPSITPSEGNLRTKLILSLYVGVVLSDMITFTLGRMMRFGLLEPLRKKLKLGDGSDIDHMSEDSIPNQTRRKRDVVMQKLEKSGDYVGFVTRFSVGIRSAMMLFTGFSGKVGYAKYLLGVSIGGIFSLTCQLLVGYSMRNNQAAVFNAIGSFSTIVLALPIGAGIITSFMYIKRQFRSDSSI